MKKFILASVLSGVMVGCTTIPTVDADEVVDNSKYGDNWNDIRKGVLVCSHYFDKVSSLEDAPPEVRSNYGALGEYFYDSVEGLDNDNLIEDSKQEVVATSNQVFRMIYEGVVTPQQVLDVCEDYITEMKMIYNEVNTLEGED
ncbi:membrane lipoprotein [Vibrio phage 1.170.O._10N.261.52.C3]|nr:membrane lipoprotein [Vibrio phage 1.170.O._10N.261.52.C3]